MTLTFRTRFDLGASMSFEACHHPLLAVRDQARKTELIENGVAAWMFADGVVMGEAYGAGAWMAQDPDVANSGYDLKTLCCFSVAIMPEYQGRKLAKHLYAYWMGLVKARGFDTIVGHAAHPALASVVRFFGAQFLFDRDHWGGTDITAHFFKMNA